MALPCANARSKVLGRFTRQFVQRSNYCMHATVSRRKESILLVRTHQRHLKRANGWLLAWRRFGSSQSDQGAERLDANT